MKLLKLFRRKVKSLMYQFKLLSAPIVIPVDQQKPTSQQIPPLQPIPIQKQVAVRTHTTNQKQQKAKPRPKQASKKPKRRKFGRRSRRSADVYKTLPKNGPEVALIRELMINGPLSCKQLWKCYSASVRSPSSPKYFASLTQMRKTVRVMRLEKKLVSAGYDRVKKESAGWKVNEKMLKQVHPEVIEEIQKQVKLRDRL